MVVVVVPSKNVKVTTTAVSITASPDNMGTSHPDNHRQSFNCRLITQFNVPWLYSTLLHIISQPNYQ